MPTISIHIPDDLHIEAFLFRLRDVAQDLGYVSERGPSIGEGYIGGLLAAIDGGEVALVPRLQQPERVIKKLRKIASLADHANEEDAEFLIDLGTIAHAIKRAETRHAGFVPARPPSDLQRIQTGATDVPCAHCGEPVDPYECWLPGPNDEVCCVACAREAFGLQPKAVESLTIRSLDPNRAPNPLNRFRTPRKRDAFDAGMATIADVDDTTFRAKHQALLSVLSKRFREQFGLSPGDARQVAAAVMRVERGRRIRDRKQVMQVDNEYNKEKKWFTGTKINGRSTK